MGSFGNVRPRPTPPRAQLGLRWPARSARSPSPELVPRTHARPQHGSIASRFGLAVPRRRGSTLGPYPRGECGESRSGRASQGRARRTRANCGLRAKGRGRGSDPAGAGTHRSIRFCRTWGTWKPWSASPVGPRPPPAPSPHRRLRPRPRLRPPRRQPSIGSAAGAGPREPAAAPGRRAVGDAGLRAHLPRTEHPASLASQVGSAGARPGRFRGNVGAAAPVRPQAVGGGAEPKVATRWTGLLHSDPEQPSRRGGSGETPPPTRHIVLPASLCCLVSIATTARFGDQSRIPGQAAWMSFGCRPPRGSQTRKGCPGRDTGVLVGPG